MEGSLDCMAAGSEPPAALMEKGESLMQKYTPVLDFEGWRVAMLRHFDGTDPAHFAKVERHNTSNEVFILTEGSADLIVCENGDRPGRPYVFSMQRNVAYNIRKSVWHHVVMSKDAHIVLFEKTEVSKENSDYHYFDEKEKKEIRERFRKELAGSE